VTTQTSAHAPALASHSWPIVLSTIALVVAVGLAGLAIRGWLPPVFTRLRKPLSAGAVLVAAILVVLAGGAMPAIAVVGIAAWAMAEVFGVAIGVAAFALAGLSAAATVAKGGPVALTIGGAVFAASTGALPYFYARHIASVHARRERRVTRLEAQITRPTPTRPLPTEALKREVLLSVERTEATKDLAMLDGFLRDLRDQIQADEAIFWRWSEERDTLIPQAWSTEESDRPEFFRVKDWGPLARWSAQERIVSFDGSEESTLLASAPVIAVQEEEKTLQGVLTVSCNSGLAFNREALKEWMPRFAGQLAATQRVPAAANGPVVLLLVEDHFGEMVGEHQHAGKHVFADGDGVNASDGGDDDGAIRAQQAGAH